MSLDVLLGLSVLSTANCGNIAIERQDKVQTPLFHLILRMKEAMAFSLMIYSGSFFFPQRNIHPITYALPFVVKIGSLALMRFSKKLSFVASLKKVDMTVQNIFLSLFQVGSVMILISAPNKMALTLRNVILLTVPAICFVLQLGSHLSSMRSKAPLPSPLPSLQNGNGNSQAPYKSPFPGVGYRLDGIIIPARI